MIGVAKNIRGLIQPSNAACVPAMLVSVLIIATQVASKKSHQQKQDDRVHHISATCTAERAITLLVSCMLHADAMISSLWSIIIPGVQKGQLR
jgi:hypothetical protein